MDTFDYGQTEISCSDKLDSHLLGKAVIHHKGQPKLTHSKALSFM